MDSRAYIINMKKLFFPILFLVLMLESSGQDLNINHYPFFRDGINPGSFIQSPKLNVLLLYNNEFWGFAQEPATQLADLSVNLNGNKLGLMVLNDIIGFDKSQNVKLRYARQFILSKSSNSHFSLGLSAGAIHKRLEASRMTFETSDDPLSYENYAHTVLDFDFGAEFQFDKFVLGLSTTHLGKIVTEFEDVNPVAHYYAYGQYTLNTRLFRFKPNVLFRYWKNTYWVDAGILAFYKDQFWLGSSYTDFHDLAFMAGLKVSSNIHFGYSFKSNMNDRILRPWNTNSHEIFLNFSFGEGANDFYPPSVRNMPGNFFKN
jgi:type IX secretion system PorP/SprF family membrane protein